MKYSKLFIAALAYAGVACADDIQGSWVDTTTTGPDYVAQYHAECRIDGNATPDYSNYNLGTPSFTTVLAVAPASLLECRVRNVNVVIPSAPIDGNWTAWTAASVAVTPADPSSVLFIQVKP